MAELDLSAVVIPGTSRTTTLSATPGNVRKVVMPTNLHRGGGGLVLSFFPVGTAAKLVSSDVELADDAAIGASAYATLPADVWTEVTVPIPGSPAYRLIASATASQVIQIEINRGRS